MPGLTNVCTDLSQTSKNLSWLNYLRRASFLPPTILQSPQAFDCYRRTNATLRANPATTYILNFLPSSTSVHQRTVF